MARRSSVLATLLFCLLMAAHAQIAPSKEMSLEEFRHYLIVIHVQEADERGVRLQMKAQASQLPVWWPAQFTDMMIASILQVDYVGLNYNYVRSCATSQQITLLTTIFATPDGQQYIAKATGNMVDQEAKGIDAANAREGMLVHDTGLPAGALQALTPTEKDKVKMMLTGEVFDCMNSGYKKAGVDITDARTKAVRALVAEHRGELNAAKLKYETANPTAGK